MAKKRQDHSDVTWMYKRHNRAAIALTQVSWCTSISGPAAWLRHFFFKTSTEIENVSQDRHMTQHVMGTAQMPIACQGFDGRPKASRHMPGLLMPAHPIGGHCPMLSMCSAIWCICVAIPGICAVPHLMLLGAETNKSFWVATSTKDKGTNYIGIQQQLMSFHPSYHYQVHAGQL